MCVHWPDECPVGSQVGVHPAEAAEARDGARCFRPAHGAHCHVGGGHPHDCRGAARWLLLPCGHFPSGCPKVLSGSPLIMHKFPPGCPEALVGLPTPLTMQNVQGFHLEPVTCQTLHLLHVTHVYRLDGWHTRVLPPCLFLYRPGCGDHERRTDMLGVPDAGVIRRWRP